MCIIISLTNNIFFHCRCLAALCIGCTFELALATLRVLCAYMQLDLQKQGSADSNNGSAQNPQNLQNIRHRHLSSCGHSGQMLHTDKT